MKRKQEEKRRENERIGVHKKEGGGIVCVKREQE